MANFKRGNIAVSSDRSNPFVIAQPRGLNLIRDNKDDSLDSDSLQTNHSWEENAQVYPESRWIIFIRVESVDFFQFSFSLPLFS